MELANNPLFERLSKLDRILLAGAGGGFDIYAGMPLFLALKSQGKEVHLANLSFASLRDDGNRLTECCYEVSGTTSGSESYFPERVLCRWYKEKFAEDISVFAFPQCGVKQLKKGYDHLVEHLQLDAIVLLDGGTDSLMRGDEVGLGTPSEDMVSLAAVSQLEIECKLLSCLGFGVDRFHGVCHSQFLEAVADLTKHAGFLGAFSLLPQMPEAKAYLELVDTSIRATPARPSIVNSSIASAVEGKFGNFHKTKRTLNSELWISPLMAMYWNFELAAVVERNLYLEQLFETESFFEVSEKIRNFRKRIIPKEWEMIPD